MSDAGGGQSNNLMYVLVGCAGLLVLGLCAATGYGVYIVVEGSRRAAVAPPVAPFAAGRAARAVTGRRERGECPVLSLSTSGVDLV